MARTKYRIFESVMFAKSTMCAQSTDSVSEEDRNEVDRGNSAAGDCVEVAHAQGMIGVRHSSDPSGALLVFSKDEWKAFVGGVRNGEFDY